MMITRRTCWNSTRRINLQSSSSWSCPLSSRRRQAQRIALPSRRNSSYLPSFCTTAPTVFSSANWALHLSKGRLDNQHQNYSTRTKVLVPAHSNADKIHDEKEKNDKRHLKMRQAASMLLDIDTFPPGELLYDAWIDAQEDILPYWLDDIDATSDENAVESVDVVFSVLNRLAMEQTAFHTLTRCQWIDLDLLERVIYHWFVVHKHHGQTSTTMRQDYAPHKVLELVEHFCEAFPQASWSTNIAHHLVVAELRCENKTTENAMFCEEILQKTLQRFEEELEDEEKVAEETHSQPSAQLFQAVLSAWTHVAVRHSSTSSPNNGSGSISITNDNNKSDKQKNETIVLEAAQKSDALLDLMKRMKIYSTPQAPCFLTAMHTWSRTNSLRGALRVEELLGEMHRYVKKAMTDGAAGDNDNDTLKDNYYMEDANDSSINKRTPWPWIDAFVCANRAWAYSKDGRAGKHVEKLLQKFQDFYDEGIIVLDEHGEGLDHEPQEHDNHSKPHNGIIAVYNAAFLCYALLGTPRAARQAQELFWRIKLPHDPSKGHQEQPSLMSVVEPNAETYYWVTAAMANGGFVAESEAIASDLVADYTASAVSHHHQQHSSSSSPVVKPLREMFHAIIIGWSRSRDPNRIKRAQAIVTAMENRRHRGDDDETDKHNGSASLDNDLSPTVETYNAYLTCLSKGPGRVDPASIQIAQEAVSVLEKMRFLSSSSSGHKNVRPDCQTYSHVIHCWANCGRAESAERYFQEMIDDYRDGNDAAKPNTTAVNLVLLAYSKSGAPGSPDRAEAFFRKFLLEQDSFSSSSDQEQQSLDLQPDLYSFSTLLNCISKRRRHRKPLSETAEAVEGVFREMQQRYRNQSDASLLRPNQIMYNIVINCWAQARNPAKAEQIFEEMYLDFTQGNNRNAEPNVRSLNTVMKAWAMSGRADSAERAEKILELMRDLHVNGILTDIQPTCVTYTTLLMSYAFQSGTTGAVATQRADAVLAEMWKLYNANLLDEAPNQVTYKTLLKIWVKSNERNKAERIRAIQQEMRVVLGKEQRTDRRRIP